MGFASEVADIIAATQSAKEAQKNGETSPLQSAIDYQLSSQRRNSQAGMRAMEAINRGTNALNAGSSSGSRDWSNVVNSLLDGIDTSKSKILENMGLLDPFSSEDPSGGSSGGGLGGGSGPSGLTGYDSYLDMLHQEQERVWNREDTYYQRAVKDMQAAGLNPVLAVSHGVSGGGSSASSDSQVVGAVADLAAMAISGLTETASGAMQLSQLTNPSFLSKAGNWYKANAKTIQTAVNTAASVGKVFAMLAG